MIVTITSRRLTFILNASMRLPSKWSFHQGVGVSRIWRAVAETRGADESREPVQVRVRLLSQREKEGRMYEEDRTTTSSSVELDLSISRARRTRV